MGSQEGRGPQTDKHLPQSPFTGQLFQITTFGISFYQSNISTQPTFIKQQLHNTVCVECLPACTLQCTVVVESAFSIYLSIKIQQTPNIKQHVLVTASSTSGQSTFLVNQQSSNALSFRTASRQQLLVNKDSENEKRIHTSTVSIQYLFVLQLSAKSMYLTE